MRPLQKRIKIGRVASILTPAPVLGKKSSTAEFIQRALDCGAGEPQVGGDGVDGRPASALRVCPISEVDVHRLCPVIYECHSVSDMVAAIIHYYMVYGFKVIPCKHCGRIFATQSLKTVYCNRISPYQNNFSQKKSRPEPCKDTVKREIQFLRKKKDRLLDRVRNSSDVMRGYTEDIYDNLHRECTQYMDLVRKSPTPENFENFNYYLESVAQNKEWKK